MFDATLPAWIAFNVVVVIILIADLLLLQRKPREMKIREALGWSGVWISLTLAFNVLICFMYANQWFGFGVEPHHTVSPRNAALEFLAGYLIELSLSVDNLFVFLAIFRYFRVEGEYQHNVLFWGILGAVVLRMIMVLVGVAALEHFEWLTWILGGFLVLTAVKMVTTGDNHGDPSKGIAVRVARKILPIHDGDHHGRIFTRVNGRVMGTTLLLVLFVVETTDLVFALDSIPAVLAVTRDPFIAYTSNIMAIIGLRALYFALAGLMDMFHFLRYGLAAVLAFVGIKMMFDIGIIESIGVSLTIIASILTLSIVASLIWRKKHHPAVAH
jgi:tellurite resistance protein TerC